MSALARLPEDQRAVLALVLQLNRGYDEIARLLAIDRAAVRQRALAAFDTLGPQTGVDDQRRALITDYLLGQLPGPVAHEVRDRLATSPPERAWARVVASELGPLASRPLPEIPTSPAAQPAGEPPVVAASAAPREASSLHQDAPRATSGTPSVEPEPPRSSRLGGMILLIGAGLVVAAVVVVIVATSGGGSKRQRSASAAAPAASATTAASSSTATTAATSTAATKVVAQINLTPTSSVSKAAGIAEVLKQGAKRGIAIVAQNMAPNTTKPPNAYAVWLYNSQTDAHLLGFVNPGVGKNGKLSTAGALPSDASHFKKLIVTLETKANPKSPGVIVLTGHLVGVS